MTTSQTPFLAEIAAGHSGPPIPAAKRAYFQERLRLKMFSFLLGKFADGQHNGLTKAVLARRIGKTPDVVTRWLGTPSNLTLDTISDLLLGIASEELEFSSSSPLGRIAHNYSHFAELSSVPDCDDAPTQSKGKPQSAAEVAAKLPSSPRQEGAAGARAAAGYASTHQQPYELR